MRTINPFTFAFAVLILAAAGSAMAQDTPPCMSSWPQNAPRCLDQNWSNNLRDGFWYIDQGSRLMPLSWFQKLKNVAGDKYLVDDLARFGFITDTFQLPGVTSLNTAGLPIGFAVGKKEGDTRDWVGLTCAACHSGMIKSGGQAYVIEGAPAMLDFDTFLDHVVKAMQAVDASDSAWAAFSDGHVDRTEFKKQLASLALRRDNNTPSGSAGPAGFGRVDAFGHIFNQVVVQHLGNPKEASTPPDAPASYPALWDIAQHQFVQWNYSAPNLGIGGKALGSQLRNIGEVLGVFGTVEIKKGFLGGWSYKSSADIGNLQKIESWVANLHSPAWPFPEQIDPVARDAGAAVYVKARCHTCHALIDPKHPPLLYPAYPVLLSEVRTDPDLATNFMERKSPTGKLKGAPKGPAMWPALIDPLKTLNFGPDDFVRNLTAHLALNMLPSKLDQATAATLGVAANAIAGLELRYKARPLNGIWATAPYLHNGSVASLRQLLTPPVERIEGFCVGDREFDVVNVGYKTYEDQLKLGQPCPVGTTLVDTTRKGSHKEGHAYLVPKSDINNLIEFLKSL